MRKRISLKTRRPGLTPEAFRDHYETRHVPLGLGFIDRFQWRRYVRNYVALARGAKVAFDAYTEFWIADDADDEALARFIASPEFRVLDEDDRRFLDVDARFSCEVRPIPFDRGLPSVEELDVAGVASRPGAFAAPLAKATLLWHDPTAASSEALAVARAATAPVVDRLAAATIERVLDPRPDAPFETLLTLRLPAEAVSDVELAPIVGLGGSLLVVDPVETPAEQLYRH